MKKCVFAGTFDPFTMGHFDTVKKCLRLFDEVVIAVAHNARKQCLLTPKERAESISDVYRGESRVRVRIWEGVIVDLLHEENTPFYVRGLRNTIDFEYENADFYASRDLDRDMVVLYIPSEREYLHVSSTLVKNCMTFGKPYRSYVPAEIYDFLQSR